MREKTRVLKENQSLGQLGGENPRERYIAEGKNEFFAWERDKVKKVAGVEVTEGVAGRRVQLQGRREEMDAIVIEFEEENEFSSAV